jgi:hypothetical protein
MPVNSYYGMHHISKYQFLASLFGLIIFSCIGIESGSSQERYIHISPGIHSSAERDHGFSPLLYTGLGIYNSMELSFNKPSKSKLFSLAYSYGTLRNKYDKTMKVYSGNFQTFTFYQSEITSKKIHWGWSNNNEFSIRDSETAGNYNFRFDYFTSLGGAMRFRQDFNLWNRPFIFQTFSHFQVFGFKITSSYVNSGIRGLDEETGSLSSAVLKSIDLFYPFNSVNIGIWPGLELPLKTGNVFSVNYRYDYVRLNNMHLVEKSKGKWFISFNYRF